jgi:hypothetical protein
VRNFFSALLDVSDAEALKVTGAVYSHPSVGHWASVDVRTEEYGHTVELRSSSPTSMRAIASRLLHEAARLEARFPAADRSLTAGSNNRNGKNDGLKPRASR